LVVYYSSGKPNEIMYKIFFIFFKVECDVQKCLATRDLHSEL
jgi:hypothetical protein